MAFFALLKISDMNVSRHRIHNTVSYTVSPDQVMSQISSCSSPYYSEYKKPHTVIFQVRDIGLVFCACPFVVTQWRLSRT